MSGPAPAPMRILEIETFGRGGLTHYAYNLSRALAERGHEVTLVTGAGYELAERVDRPDNVRVIPSIGRLGYRYGEPLPGPASSLLRKLEAVADAFATASLAARLRPDVIHLHCTNPIALLYLGRLRRLGIPLVATAHVVTPHERIRFQESIYRRAHRLPELIVAHSEHDKRRLTDEFSVEPERVVVIPHGEYGFFAAGSEASAESSVEARRSLGLAPESEVALFFGYIREYKGLDVLLEAWPAVARARSAARVVVAGDPVQLDRRRREALERQATEVGAIHRFGYVPFDEVSRYFAAADTLVMPYRHISQSGVLYLALSLGVPVVATRVGGLEEMLRDGRNALLVDPESPAELARALIRVLGEPELRQRLAAGGRELARSHSWPAIAERTEAAFAKLTAAQRDAS